MDGPNRWWQSPWVHVPAIILVFFVVTAPVLRWLDFCDGMETFNVLTAVETLDEGHWAVPTLNGQPRLQKPPFTHWSTSLGILSSDSLEWGSRWPTLLMACIMLAGVYDLGKSVRDWRLGLLSALICGTTFFFIRYSRRATYDMQLAMWVVLTNAFLARAFFRNQRWLGCCGAGLALGAALMTKGPPALFETILPVGFFAGWDIWYRRRQDDRQAGPSGEAGRVQMPAGSDALGVGLAQGGAGWRRPLIAGAALLAIVSLPWVIYILDRYSLDTVRLWINEVRLQEERAAGDTTPRWEVFVFLPQMVPWTLWLIAGLVVMFWRQSVVRFREAVFTVLIVVVPLACLVVYPPVRNRYMVPMAGPAAVIAAWGLLQCLSTWRKPRGVDRAMVVLHWVTVGTMAVGLPLMGSALSGSSKWAWHAVDGQPPTSYLQPPWAGTLALRSVDGQPWFPLWPAIATSLALAGVLLLTLRLQRRRVWVLPVGTLVLLLVFQFAYNWGNSTTASGRSEAKEPARVILQRYPNAEVYADFARKFPRELGVYLGRTVRPLPEGRWPANRDNKDVVVLAQKGLLPENVPGDVVRVMRFQIGRSRWVALARPASKE